MKSLVLFLVVFVASYCTAMPAEAQEPSVRERRFVSPVNQPQPPNPQESRGRVDVDVHREKGVGTVVRAEGEGNVWKSKDGNSRVDAGGNWERVYRGPARGRPRYSGGVRFSHRW